MSSPAWSCRSQNSWPSLRLDVGAANQVVAPFIGAGFYYKTFIKPQRLWPYYEKVLQRFAAGGRVSSGSPHARYDKRYAHPDVLVAGGGPAGMAAALAAAAAGARVMLVEEEYELGGHLRWGDQPSWTRSPSCATDVGPTRGHRGPDQLGRHRSLRRQLDRRRRSGATRTSWSD